MYRMAEPSAGLRVKAFVGTLGIVARHSLRTRHSDDAARDIPPPSVRARAVRLLLEFGTDGRITSEQQKSLMAALMQTATDDEVAGIVQQATELALPSPFPEELHLSLAHERWESASDWRAAHRVRLDATDATVLFDFTRARMPARGFTLDCAVQDSRIEIRLFEDVRIDTADLAAHAVNVRVKGHHHGRDEPVIRVTGRVSGGRVTVKQV
jgi:hypothetical protein